MRTVHPAFARRSRSLFALAALSLLVPLAACGGGGGGGGGGSVLPSDEGHVDVGVTDAPSDQLAAFRIRVDDVRLVRQDASETANLLAAPIDVELLGLAGVFAWLSSADLPAGTYAGARLGFVPETIDAIAQDGTPVAVQSSGDELGVAFATPLVVGADTYQRVQIDVDLRASLVGDVASPPLTFTPQGSASVDDGTGPGFVIDEIKGRVRSFDASAATIVVDAFADEDVQVEIGEVTVRLQPSTLLLSDDGAQLSPSELFAALQPELTLLEIHGLLTAGVVQAERIEIEDQAGIGDDDHPVKIEGIVVSHELGAGFELLIVEIERGAAIVEPVLALLADPHAIDVVYDSATLFFADDGGLASPEAMAVGRRVKVKFQQFLSEPFRASRVELEHAGVHVDGFFVDLAGLPDSFVMHAEPGEPVIPAAIASSSTDVTVDLAGAPLFLDTEGEPALSPSDLLVGLAVEVEGPIDGPSTAPSIDASKVKVRAGRLRGARVVSIDRASGSFVVEGGEVDDPFGASLAGPVTARFEPGAVVEDDASSIDGFFDLFESLAPGETLVVEIEGIGTAEASTVRAFQVGARIED